MSLTMLIATEPATPTVAFLPPAPEVAEAVNEFIGVPEPVIPALSETPWVLIVVGWPAADWIVASSEALARFKATAAPTPT